MHVEGYRVLNRVQDISINLAKGDKYMGAGIGLVIFGIAKQLLNRPALIYSFVLSWAPPSSEQEQQELHERTRCPPISHSRIKSSVQQWRQCAAIIGSKPTVPLELELYSVGTRMILPTLVSRKRFTDFCSEIFYRSNFAIIKHRINSAKVASTIYDIFNIFLLLIDLFIILSL